MKLPANETTHAVQSERRKDGAEQADERAREGGEGKGEPCKGERDQSGRLESVESVEGVEGATAAASQL